MSGAIRVVLIVAIGLLVAGAACTAPSNQTQKVVLAIQPTSNPEALTNESREIESFLESRLDGVDVEIRVPTLYAGVVEALRFGNADAAFMSAWPAALAGNRAGAQVVLAEVREVVIGDERVERPFYYSYWVVPENSPIQSLGELRGKRAAFPSPLSTSGFVFPVARLVELGFLTPGNGPADPRRFFGEVFFAGGYAQAWEALKRGQVDVSVIAGDVPEKLYREVLDATRVIERQGPIPSHAVVFSKDLSEPMRSNLKNALLELGSPENRPLMRKFISGIFVGFVESNNDEHLATLSGALEATGQEFNESLK